MGCLQAGGNHYILKPFDRDRVVEKVNQLYHKKKQPKVG